MAKTMLAQAEFLKLIDLEISEALEADAKGTCDTVGQFVKTLPPIERERLLGSIPGDNFLKLASESDCGSMLHAPAIANHITVRWAGDLVNAITTGKGIYQWGNELPLTSQQHWTLIVMLPFVWVINMLLLPFVAMYPPLADMLRSLLQDNFGVLGFDSRDPNSETRNKGVIGYSPYFRLLGVALFCLTCRSSNTRWPRSAASVSSFCSYTLRPALAMSTSVLLMVALNVSGLLVTL